MKKALKIIFAVFGTILLICLILVVGVVIWSSIQKNKTPSYNFEQVQTLTQGYAIDTAAAFSAAWDWNELKKRARPEFLKIIAKMSDEDLQKVTKNMHEELGDVKDKPVCTLTQFRTYAASLRGNPGYLRADYHCKVQFQKGQAEMEMWIVQENYTGPLSLLAFSNKTHP